MEEGVVWMQKVFPLIEEAKKSKIKHMFVDAPKDKQSRDAALFILKNNLKLKVEGEKNKEWKIVLM